jgi:glycerol-3-phosphate acyltransferase PlsY
MIEAEAGLLLTALIAGYLLGAIPFGLVLTKLAGYGDLRRFGSGNIGATNVLRTGNKPLAAATLVLDIGKGAAAALLIMTWLGRDFAIIAGLGAIAGHLYPVWLKFKGGKGVATTVGTILALSPMVGAAVCGIWLLVALLFRYSSLAALVSIALSPLLAHFLANDPVLAGMCAIVLVMIWFKHRGNMQRLVAGQEPKIGEKRQ